MAKIDFDEAKSWVTSALSLHAHDLIKALASRYQVSSSTASATVKKLEQAGVIKRTGAVNRPIFEAASNITVMQSYSLPLGDAEQIWQRDFAPFLMQDLNENLRKLISSSFTAIANNASQHSQGNSMHVIAEQTADHIELTVQDNGIGVFKQISKTKQCADLAAAAALLERSNSAIKALAQKFDFFLIEANGMHYPEQAAPAVDTETEELFEQGTTVIMELTLS
ncbi:Lrp/AsnC family transcriptional regulator [Solimicrobium silvestre]|uniref:MarR family n=1 Tax=Solimicrobium silvestre TaxID=2099400 RepID=A0A2S9H2H8_9BURK|nr:Lrp/AsnC family transcriptional regulator [Solimicrobium silvestre]PRC94168.1 MarR family [Solimicrobium silvestre]